MRLAPMHWLKVLQDTTFKQSTLNSTQLAPEQLHAVKAGAEFPIAAWAAERNGHTRFTLGRDDAGQMVLSGRNTWLAFSRHVQITKAGRPVSPLPPRNAPGRYRLHLSGDGSRDEWGCLLFWLAVQQDGKEIGAKIPTISGAPGKKIIYPTEDFSGSNAPIYEGVFTLGPVERGYWGEAIGGIWVSIDPLPSYKVNNRTAIGFHEDANRNWRPGSAGCICPLNLGDTEYMAAQIDKLAIRELVVDHGQGWLAKRNWRG